MYKSIFISDIHLGFSYCKSKNLFELLEKIESEKIFLVGDIINCSTKKEHPDVIKFITLLHSKPWDIIYIAGNHEDERSRLPLVSLDFKNDLFPIDNYIYDNGDKKIYIEHGHSFHKKNRINIALNQFIKFLKYDFLKKTRETITNKSDKSEGDSFYYKTIKPLAQKILIYSFQSHMVSSAKKHLCDTVICGHFHIPNNKKIKNIDYLNCGDWIEHSSYIVEDMSGEFTLISK